MSMTAFTGARVLDPERPEAVCESLLVASGRILQRLPADAALPDAARSVALDGRCLAPGFLDLHHHGGWVFDPAPATPSSLARTSASLVHHGTTGFLATTLAWPQDELRERIPGLAALAGAASLPGAEVLGIHLEGPWINPRAAGAQPGGIREPAPAEFDELLALASGTLRMVTLAPEIPGAAQLQARLAERGIVTALGHSLADAAEVADAIDRGATHVTHLFNAMSPAHHREPGLAGAALADDRLSCDLICDGAHVHRDMVRVAARAKGEALVLITDQIEVPPARAQTGFASFGSGGVYDDGTAVRFEDGRLAGSSVTLDRALRNFSEYTGASLLEAVAACTLRPARVLGIENERGTLREGARADFAILDDAGRVVETWIEGRRVFGVPIPA